ncbi:hypothetical protein MTO96_037876 [Rhipicephalus appendiculatus]
MWEAGRKYDIDEKRVRYYIKQKDALAATNRSRKAFRGKKFKYPQFKGELVKYANNTQRDGYAASTDMIRVKSLNITRPMEIPQAQFKMTKMKWKSCQRRVEEVSFGSKCTIHGHVTLNGKTAFQTLQMSQKSSR